jgi:hypothetical protein
MSTVVSFFKQTKKTEGRNYADYNITEFDKRLEIFHPQKKKNKEENNLYGRGTRSFDGTERERSLGLLCSALDSTGLVEPQGETADYRT